MRASVAEHPVRSVQRTSAIDRGFRYSHASAAYRFPPLKERLQLGFIGLSAVVIREFHILESLFAFYTDREEVSVLKSERHITRRYIKLAEPVAFENPIQGVPISRRKVSLVYSPFLIFTPASACFFSVKATIGKHQHAIALRGHTPWLHFREHEPYWRFLFCPRYLTVAGKGSSQQNTNHYPPLGHG